MRFFSNSPYAPWAGVPERSKRAGSGPAGVGLRGFESRPPHHILTRPVDVGEACRGIPLLMIPYARQSPCVKPSGTMMKGSG